MDEGMDGWTRGKCPSLLVFLLKFPAKGAMLVPFAEFLSTLALGGTGGAQSLCLLLPCCAGQAPLFIQPPFDLLNCC